MLKIKKTKKSYASVNIYLDRNGNPYYDSVETNRWKTPVDVFTTLHEFGHISLGHMLVIHNNRVIDARTGEKGKVWQFLLNELDAWIYALDCVKDGHKVDCMNEAVDCLWTYVFDHTAYTALFIEYFEERIERFNFPENEIRRWTELLGLLETSESLKDY